MSLFGSVLAENSNKRVYHGTFLPTAGTTVINLSSRFSTIDAIVAALDIVDLTHMWTSVGWNPSTRVATFVHTRPTAVDNVTPTPAINPWNNVHYIVIGNKA